MSTDLLARLAQRPPMPGPARSNIEQPMYFAMQARRAEFDRDLALDALADLEMLVNTVEACYSRNPGNWAAAITDLYKGAETARTILAELRGTK